MSDTYRTVNKALQLDTRSLTYCTYLLAGQSSLQNHTRKTAPLQETHPLGRHIAHLGRGVKFDLGQIHTSECQILHNQCIDTRRNHLACSSFRLA